MLLQTRTYTERGVTKIPDTRIFSLDGSSTSPPGIVDFSRIGTKWMIDATIPAHLSENERKNFEPAFYECFCIF